MSHTQIILFGITGDLSRRKLLPALEAIVATGHHELEIIGVTRQSIHASELLKNFPSLQRVTRLFQMSLVEPEDYLRLHAEAERSAAVSRVVYLSVPPGAAGDIAEFLADAGFTSEKDKILFEKPFGYDMKSADELLRRTAARYDESRVYRIDHYMAKEVARTLLALRQDAARHHHAWSRDTVARVEVVAHETIGVEGRAAFYEQTGAIRDVLQGHLLQLLSLVLMSPPADTDALPAARLAALEQLRLVATQDVVKRQYPGYREEVTSPHSQVETYAQLTLYSQDARWSGVPLVLETGKKMPTKKTCVRVIYLDGTVDEFDETEIVFAADTELKDAYEHVLLSAIEGERSIFIGANEVRESWRIVEPAFDAPTHIV